MSGHSQVEKRDDGHNPVSTSPADTPSDKIPSPDCQLSAPEVVGVTGGDKPPDASVDSRDANELTPHEPVKEANPDERSGVVHSGASTSSVRVEGNQETSRNQANPNILPMHTFQTQHGKCLLISCL